MLSILARGLSRVGLVLSLGFAVQAQAAPDVTPPSTTVCGNLSFPSMDTGSTPSTPGLWWNPKRSGSGWSLAYSSDNRGLHAVWYTYDSSGAPVWLESATNQIDTYTNTWSAPLYKYTWNTAANAFGGGTRVGSLAVSFYPNDPTRVALTWQWDEAGSTPRSECIFDYLRQGPLPSSNSLMANANSTFNGAWYEPAFGGWGVYVATGLVSALQPSQYAELYAAAIYDSAGEPVWLLSSDANSPTAPPMDDGFRAHQLNYTRSSYPGGVPTTDCERNCVISRANVGSFRRTFSTSTTGIANINVVASSAQLANGRAISWQRPLGGFGSVQIQKLTQANSILVDRLQCGIQSGQSTCPVTIDWDGTASTSAARAFRIDIGTGVVTMLTPNAASGETVDYLPNASRVRYELHAGPTTGYTLLSKTPEVRVFNQSPVAAPAPENRSIPSPSTASDVVGATPGEFRVDESGAANYSMPLYTPPGSGGVSPKLSLNYSSAAGDSLLGVGWSLSGTSMISRCRKTVESGDGAGPHPPVNFTGTDQFCVDGQRLVLYTGTHGAAGATYRTELDGFTKFVIENATTQVVNGATVNLPLTFVAYGKDGTIRRYGDDTRYVAQTNTTVTTNGRLQSQVNGQGMTLAWAQTELNDVTGNNPVVFAYWEPAGAALIGEQRLETVYYNGGRLTFTYETRTGFAVDVVYSAGAQVTRSKRLKQVDVQAERTRGVMSGVRLYKLVYQLVPENPYRERLYSVQECADASTCYNPTVFTWAAFSATTYQSTSSTTSAQYYFAGMNNYKYADVDGDGRADVVWHDEEAGQPGVLDKIKVAYSAPSASGIDFQPYLGSTVYQLGNNYSDDRSWYLFDFNGDGREDLIYAKYDPTDQTKGNWVVLLASSTLSASTRQNTEPFESANAINPTTGSLAIGYTESYAEGRLLDLNGDGLPDLVTAKKTNTSTRAFLEVRFLKRNPNYSSTATGTDPNRLMYVFDSTPVELSLSGMLNNCSTFTFDKYNVEHLDAVDVNGDGIADLRLRETYNSTCSNTASSVPAISTGASPDAGTQATGPASPDAVDASGDTYWTVFISQGYQGGTQLSFVASNSTRWKSHGTGEVASDDDDKFHLQDINGDGLADVIYKRASALTWYFQLNQGNGTFGPETCVLGTNAACQDVRNPNLVQILDFDGDGRSDFWTRESDIGSTDKTYSVRLWTGTGFSQTAIPTQFIGEAGSDAWIRSFADIDGDGRLDNVQFLGTKLDQSSESGYGNWKAIRFADHHKPRHVIQAIVNGLGATTLIDYAPMSWTSLYRRDYVAPTFAYGRQSPIFDMSGAGYVVRNVTSSAPTALSGSMSQVWYRYEGLKVQGGGRGSLGFRQLLTYDPVTGIESATDYMQNFPVAGMARITRSKLLGAADRWESTDACTVGNWDAPACYARPTNCNSAGVCDFTSPGTQASYSVNTWRWRKSDDPATVGMSLANLPPTPLFIYRWAASTQTYEIGLNSNVPAGTLLAQTSTYTIDWDNYGNALTSMLSKFDGALATVQTVNSSFTYDNLTSGSQWLLGRLRTSTVTTGRPGLPDVVRSAAFEYDPTTGLLTTERTQPGGTVDVARNVFYSYDAYGNKIKAVTCSGQIADATCRATSAATLTFKPADPNWVQRYTRTEFDALGRYVERSYAPFFNGVGATEIKVSEITSRDAAGNPLTSVDANGVSKTFAYGALGRKYFEKTSTGGSVETWYGRCGVGVTCPIGAVFEQRTVTAGAPTVWTYFDVLGREMLSVRQGFGSSEYVTQRKTYDALGRVSWVSEPFFVTGSGANAGTPTSGTTVYWTRTMYDPLGRVTQVTAPNSAVTTMRYNGLQTATTLPANGTGLVQTRTELRNPLGEIVQVQEANGHIVNYAYKATGELATVTRTVGTENVVTTMGYDVLGRKTSMTDPDMGSWTYWQNAAGETVKQVSPRGNCTQSLYDAQGRLYGRKDFTGNGDLTSAGCSGTLTHEAMFQYDTASNGIGALASDTQYQNGALLQTRTYAYDGYARPQQTTIALDGQTYRQRVTYDQWSRRLQSFFQDVSDGLPEVGEYYTYNGQGYSAKIQDAVPDALGLTYYDVLTMNARGQVVTDDRGISSLGTSRVYEPSTGRLTEIQTSGGSVQWLKYSYDVLGNTMTREDRTAGKSLLETFSFDAMQRLKSSTVTSNGGSVSSATYTYDGGGAGPGNITTKAVTGSGTPLSYAYSNKEAWCSAAGEVDPGPHAASNVSGVSYCYDAAGNQTRSSDGRSVTYNAFDLPSRITHTQSIKAVGFDYGPARERVRRLDYDTTAIGAAPALVTHFVGDAEIVRWATGEIEVRRYVAGLIRVQRRTAVGGAVSERLDYLFTDAQGSTYAVTNSLGQLRDGSGGTSGSAMSFDAWGQRRSALNWADLGNPLNFNVRGLTEHGYTGHEEVDSVGLIHMNGRIYDPKLMRFVQADPMVQAPYSGQSFNRYAYVFNNPLAMTDPSGYWGKRQQGYLRAVVAIVITVYTGGAAAGVWGSIEAGSAEAFGVAAAGGFAAGAIQTGSLKGGLQGAFSAAMFYGIGSYFQGANWAHAGGELSAPLTTAGWAVKSLSHGVAGGIMNELQGGNFGHGFASAGVAEALNPAADMLGKDPVSQVVGAAVIGGTSSVLAGGKFANGAVTAAFGAAFNQLSHPASEGAPAEYDSKDPRYHRYQLGPTALCELGTEGCTLPSVLDVVNNVSVPFVAHPQEGRMLIGPLKDPIFHYVDHDKFRIYNITDEGHTFHPGQVEHSLSIGTRTIFDVQSLRFVDKQYIFLTTIGTGYGSSPAFNNFVGNQLFSFTHVKAQAEMRRLGSGN